jgi:hypothetical protein
LRPQAVSAGYDRLDTAAKRGYNASVKTVSFREAKNHLTELAREVEQGETG